jgi:hypothetical protein
LFVDASGNVGVAGTPTARFTVVGSAGSVQVASDGATLNFTRDAANYIQAAGAGATLSYRSPVHIFTGASLANEYMRITSAGRVGIGTSAPTHKLHVVANLVNLKLTELAAGSENSLSLGNSAGLYWTHDDRVTAGLELSTHRSIPGTYPLSFKTQSSTALFIDTSSRVGIGTTSPLGDLHLHSSTSGTGPILNLTNDTGDCRVFFGQNTSVGSANAAGQIRYSVANNTMAFYTNLNERARIDNGGRLLVGTSSARTNVFTIAPRIQYEGSGAAENRFVSFGYSSADAAGPGIAIFKTRAASAGGNTAVVDADMLGELRFCGADGTNIIRGAAIGAFVDGTPGADDMPGRLVFSVTADGAASPTERMRIGSTGAHQMLSDSTILSLRRSAGTSTTGAFFDGRHDASMTTDGTRTIVIRVDGDVENANNSYGALSDFKLKENIVDASSQWSDLKDLRIRNYNFKPETGYGTHTQLGLIAQEVELVSPGLVSESPDCDEDGNDLGTVTKSVNYSVLYMKAVKALQEAMERIEQLEAKVAALKAQVVPFSKMLGVGSPLVRTGGQRTWKVGSIPARPLAS